MLTSNHSGVDLDWSNGHSLTFYPSEARRRTRVGCKYLLVELASGDLDVTWHRLDELGALYLIT